MDRRIYFFANFGNWDKLPLGGGEVGNRKTLDLLIKAGFDVIPIPKYKRVKNHSFINCILLLWRVFKNICTYIYILVCGRRCNSIVHIVGFYGNMIYFEALLVFIAKILNYKTIYEMRGGGSDSFYYNNSFIYRLFFINTIKKADCIFSQGKENYLLLHSIKNDCDIFYYPNYVMDDFYPKEYPLKDSSQINLIYFGRISKSKNIDLIIDVFKIISQKFDNVYLDIIGNCYEEKYLSIIKKKISQDYLENRVKLYPACNHESLKKHLRNKHFYIFPSVEQREGHSNALTEAMSWGLIPIATSHGFNKTVIGNERLCVNQLIVDEFVDIISDIIMNGEMDRLSFEMYERVQNFYTENKVFYNLKQKYNDLFDSYQNKET